MRKVVAGLFITLDGVVEAPYKWQFDVFDNDMAAAMQAHIDAIDTVLLGRVTYQDWAPYWPSSTDEPFASFINNVPKYVVSTTLEQTDWQNSTLIRDHVAEEVAALQQQPGKNIGVMGSPTLVESLLRAGLLDELTLMLHPVVAGEGKRLFNEGHALERFDLLASKVTSTGVAFLTYRPQR